MHKKMNIAAFKSKTSTITELQLGYAKYVTPLHLSHKPWFDQNHTHAHCQITRGEV